MDSGFGGMTWDDVLARLSTCSRGRASAMISVTILINEDGTPELMTKPEVTPLEPACGDPAMLLKLLAARRGLDKP